MEDSVIAVMDLLIAGVVGVVVYVLLNKKMGNIEEAQDDVYEHLQAMTNKIDNFKIPIPEAPKKLIKEQVKEKVEEINNILLGLED